MPECGGNSRSHVRGGTRPSTPSHHTGVVGGHTFEQRLKRAPEVPEAWVITAVAVGLQQRSDKRKTTLEAIPKLRLRGAACTRMRSEHVVVIPSAHGETRLNLDPPMGGLGDSGVSVA
jgi:hypothetical protein